MKTKSSLLLAALAVLATATTGCSNALVQKYVGKRVSPTRTAPVTPVTPGTANRVPLVALDDQLHVSDALKGVTFSIAPAQPLADCPLPGCTPGQSVENVAAGANFRIAWRRDIGRGSARTEQVTAPPVLAEGHVFTMDGNATVSAFDAQTGRKVWSADLSIKNRRDRRAYGGGLAYADGRLFVASGYRFVAAVDAKTGSQIWKTETKLPFHSAPTVAGGRVIVSTITDDLETFDASTGQPGWTFQALLEPTRIIEAGSPAVTNDTVVTGFASGELTAVQIANGNPLWSGALTRLARTSALSEIRDIPGRPIISRGVVYAGSHSGVAAAIDLRTGQAKWQIPIITMATPWASGDVVYFVSKAGEVVCVARETGQVYWIRDLNEGRVAVRSSKLLGLQVTDRPYWTGVVMASGRLVTVSSDGRAAALDPLTGEVTGYLKLGRTRALITPMAADGMIYVVTDKGELIAID